MWSVIMKSNSRMEVRALGMESPKLWEYKFNEVGQGTERVPKPFRDFPGTEELLANGEYLRVQWGGGGEKFGGSVTPGRNFERKPVPGKKILKRKIRSHLKFDDLLPAAEFSRKSAEIALNIKIFSWLRITNGSQRKCGGFPVKFCLVSRCFFRRRVLFPMTRNRGT